jgi:hypothetical protein
MQAPTRLLPGGFLFVFFGLLALAFSSLSGYAGWLAFHKEVIEKQAVPYAYSDLFWISGAGLVVAVALFYYGIKVALERPDFKL